MSSISVISVRPQCVSLMCVLNVLPLCVLDVSPQCVSSNVCPQCVSSMCVHNVCPQSVSSICVLNVFPRCVASMCVLNVCPQCPQCVSLICVLNVCPQYMSSMCVINVCPNFVSWAGNFRIVDIGINAWSIIRKVNKNQVLFVLAYILHSDLNINFIICAEVGEIITEMTFIFSSALGVNTNFEEFILTRAEKLQKQVQELLEA